jgi:hypothetical protein
MLKVAAAARTGTLTLITARLSHQSTRARERAGENAGEKDRELKRPFCAVMSSEPNPQSSGGGKKGDTYVNGRRTPRERTTSGQGGSGGWRRGDVDEDRRKDGGMKGKRGESSGIYGKVVGSVGSQDVSNDPVP